MQDKPGNKVYQSVRFIIVDIDDNPPIFKNTPYIISISENQELDTVLFDSIEAYDLDGPLHNKFKFELSTFSSNSELFSLGKTESLGAGRFRTSLILKQKLDYEKAKSHVLTVNAIGENSNFKPTSTEILVNVIDYPDKPPQFSQSPYYVNIDEEQDVGSFVLRVFAKDGDSGIANSCLYKLLEDDVQNNEFGLPTQNAWSFFQIHHLSGVITIRKRIDLESEEISHLGGLLEFWVMAFEINDENSQQKVKIVVKINDINDNEPKFNHESYTFVVSSKATIGSSINLVNSEIDSIHVKDTDKVFKIQILLVA